jgi:hypothetical protein
MDDEPLSFEEHRRQREENASLVRCARCGKMIVATLTRCPECGIHFQGEAQDYLHPSERAEGRPASTMVVVLVALLLVALVIAAIGLR